jgi:hypothetical protein
MTPTASARPQIYDDDGDTLMQQAHRTGEAESIVLVPDAYPSRTPTASPRIRIMWGQHLLEDLLLGRYRTLICAVNDQDNGRGIIAQLAELLPTSQWDEPSITAYAARFREGSARVKVLKFDMDIVEVLAILRPPGRAHLIMDDLTKAFKIVSQMVSRKPARLPSASVSFLGARTNALLNDDGREPTFEAVLRTMSESGYCGDVYPSPAMWHMGQTGLYPRYPFPAALDQMRAGGS